MPNRIPKFRSLEEERRFWQTHDITDFWDDLTPVRVTFRTPRRTQAVRLTKIELHMLHALLRKITTAAHPTARANRK